MSQRYGSTITICLACAATLLGHVWLARQQEHRLAALIAPTRGFSPQSSPWDVPDPDDVLRSLPDELPSAEPLPRLLATATYQTDEPADALRTAPAERPLTRRQLDDQAAVREVIEAEMPETSAEERDIWFDELKSLPAEAVRDLLHVRRQLRVLSPEHQLSGPSELQPMTQPQARTEVHEIPAESISQSHPVHAEDWSQTRQAVEQAIAWATHNIANAATPGYKRIDTMFGDVYSQGEKSVDQPLVGRGSGIKSLRLDLHPGNIEATHRNLDLAIEGEGFLILQDSNCNTGFCYSRCGAVTLDDQRQLSLQVGEQKLTLDPPIVLPIDAHEITISPQGTVTYQTADSDEPVPAGQLQLARFADASQLIPLGNSVYGARTDYDLAFTSTPGTSGLGIVRQGFLELSNVDVEQEISLRESWETILRALPTGNLPRTAREERRIRN